MQMHISLWQLFPTRKRTVGGSGGLDGYFAQSGNVEAIKHLSVVVIPSEGVSGDKVKTKQINGLIIQNASFNTVFLGRGPDSP